LLEPQGAGADGDHITLRQIVLEALRPVDEDVVGAAPDLPVDDDAIDETEEAISVRDVRVVTRRLRVSQDDVVVVGRAADRANVLCRQWVLPLSPAGVGDSDQGHAATPN
jgi:hypothetical protein